jgi:hypothetical protein
VTHFTCQLQEIVHIILPGHLRFNIRQGGPTTLIVTSMA